MEKVGKKIRRLRIDAGLTQSDLAKKLSISQALVSLWEKNKQYPSNRNMRLLEKALGSLSSVTRKVDSTPISEWLKKARASKRLSVPELAAMAQVGTNTVYLIENGTVQQPQESTINSLERALGEVLPKEFSEDIEEESRINGVGKITDFDPHDEQNLPNTPGLYVLYDRTRRPIYVGQSGSIARRLSEHEQKFWFKSPIVQMASFIHIEDENVRLTIERILRKLMKGVLLINNM